MDVITSKAAGDILTGYPIEFNAKLEAMRQLIIQTAEKTDGIDYLEEAVKWGEPSYRAATGSPVRLAWKKERPEHYALFFNCNTTLVETFKGLYGSRFEYEGNRAIWFSKRDRVPVKEVGHCLALAHTYHKRKKFPKLWAGLSDLLGTEAQ